MERLRTFLLGMDKILLYLFQFEGLQVFAFELSVSSLPFVVVFHRHFACEASTEIKLIKLQYYCLERLNQFKQGGDHVWSHSHAKATTYGHTIRNKKYFQIPEIIILFHNLPFNLQQRKKLGRCTCEKGLQKCFWFKEQKVLQRYFQIFVHKWLELLLCG